MTRNTWWKERYKLPISGMYTGDITTDTTDIKNIIKAYYDQTFLINSKT